MVDPRQRAAARALATDVAGPPVPALRAAGQAVIVRSRRVPAGAPAVTAYAERRVLTTAAVADPRLRAFVEYWLGRAAG